MLTEPNPFYTVNTNAHFTCDVGAFPAPAIKWTFLSCPYFPKLDNCTAIDLQVSIIENNCITITND